MAVRSEIEIRAVAQKLMTERTRLHEAGPIDDALADAMFALEWVLKHPDIGDDLIARIKDRGRAAPRGRVYSPGSLKERVATTADGTQGMKRGVATDPYICSCGAVDENSHRPWCVA